MIPQKVKALLIVLSITCSGHAQLDNSYIETFKKKPKSFSLDIIEQKRKGNSLEVRKITRYELQLDYSLIKSQTVYDTMSGDAYNKRVNYTYSDDMDNNLLAMTITNFKDEPVSKVNYEWDSRGLLLTKEVHLNDMGTAVKTITYKLSGCDSLGLEDANNSEFSNCETAITQNNYKAFKKITAFGIDGILQEWSYKDMETLSYSTAYFYNDKGQKIKEIKTTASGREVTSIFEYNEQGDMTLYKAGYVEFAYDYTYDTNGNWITKNETPKNGSIERLYKRVLVYR